MEVNVKLLTEIADVIVGKGINFDMGTWGFSAYNPETRKLELKCDAPMCMAGWACLLEGVDLAGEAIPEAAQRVLGLTDEQAGLLFSTMGWPDEFTSAYAASRHNFEERAKVTARRIHHFIETGE